MNTLCARAPFLFIAIPASCITVLPGEAPVHPDRPTFSSTTTVAGYGATELEAGLLVDPSDFIDTPVFLEFGTGDRTEVLLGLSPFQTVDTPGENESGFGDVLIGMRQRIHDETNKLPSAAFELKTRIPTSDAKDGRSTGETDFFAAAMATKTVDDFDITAFYQLGVLGEVDSGDVDLQHGFAVAAEYELVDTNFTAFTEFASIFTPEQDNENLFITHGVFYALSPSLVLDVGFSIPLTDDAEDFRLLLGVTTAGHFHHNWTAQ